MTYSTELTANGNETTTFYDFTACGDFPECHAEPRACSCPTTTPETTMNEYQNNDPADVLEMVSVAIPADAWCPDCRRTVTVEDVSTEGHYETGREVEYQVQHLACGHSNEGTRRDVGQAPGAPWAPGAMSLRDARTWKGLASHLGTVQPSPWDDEN